MPRTLREEVVGDTQRHLFFLMQLSDHFIIFGIVLEAAAGVNRAGQAQTVQLTHKLAGGVNLLFQRQLRAFRQRGVEDHCIGTGNQQAGGIAVTVALDFTPRRVRRLFGVANHFQCGAVEQGAVIKVQQENRCVRGRFVDLIQRRHPALGKLELGPATDDTYPLR